ncbi:uncharacterized protein N7459_001196 [Penicillium hispanicum]|uniref:uncharacterized protein n=1 Tax=Penicillium hispanicum TaxID=1080232 RepID=UPI0025421C00|nr:uncharacterized protein N7459_001196 [Penicillium hispanicum]KAJ5594988.1 hypothetical protein N7459_001196 [Penicillium hispanicum]
MSAFAQTARGLLRPSTVSFTGSVLSSWRQIACLHQQGPSRSAVVHEQALPQDQSPASSIPHSQQPGLADERAPLDGLVSQIPLVQSLRQSHQVYRESRPHLSIPPALRQHHFVAGVLAGTGKLAISPYLWTTSRKTDPESTSQARASSLVSIFHIGRDLCGHPGFVHGGLLSVMLDEAFARCVSAALPSGLGMTANLNIDFRKPALPDRMYVLRAETVKIEGRKVWVEGRLICLPQPIPGLSDGPTVIPNADLLQEDSEGAVMVAEGKALFVEPKFASSMVSVYHT